MPRDAKPGNIDLPRARAALAALDLAAPTMKTDAARTRLAAHLDTLKEDPMAPRPSKPEAERKSTTLAVRFDRAELARLDQVGEALSARTPGLTLSRSGAVRAAVSRGLDALEVELGLKPAPKAEQAKRASRSADLKRAPRGGP